MTVSGDFNILNILYDYKLISTILEFALKLVIIFAELSVHKGAQVDLLYIRRSKPNLFTIYKIIEPES